MRVPLFTLLGSFCLRVCKGGKQPTGAATRKKDILRFQQAAWNFFRQPKTVSFVVKVSLVVMLGLFFLGTLGASVKGAHAQSQVGYHASANHALASKNTPNMPPTGARSEEHTSELQSPCNLVCRLLLEKKKNISGSLAAVLILRYTQK